MDNEMLEKLALFRALNDSQNDEDAGDDICVSSLSDAKKLLQRHMSPEGALYRRKLVAYITDPDNEVKSECVAYHNFLMDLFRTDDYDLGLSVCDYALRAAPYDRDILADAIRACGESNQFAKGEQYLARAMEIPYKFWSYRLFLYSVDFLKNKLNARPMDDFLYQRAKELAEKYIEIFPYDEHGYNQKAELLLILNKREEAIDLLQEAIKEVSPNKDDSASRLVTAQCCVTLLDILDDSNDYDFIIEICEYGLRNTTQEQPSARIGYFVYRKALALDAKAHKEDFKIPTTVNDALKFYQSAYDLNQDRQYAQTIEKRYAVLRPHAQNFTHLIKRNLYITEDQNDSTSEEV